MANDIVTINNGFTTRTNATSGRSRTTIEVRSEPVIHNLDPKALGKPAIEAMLAVIRGRIESSGRKAAAATLRAREAAARAYAGIQERRQQAAGTTRAKAATRPTAPKFSHPKLPQKLGPARQPKAKTGVLARYSGGKIGAMPPNQSDKLFVDSGRFLKSLAIAAARGSEWVINTAANRLSPDTLDAGGEGSPQGALVEIVKVLHELVPELADPRLWSDNVGFRRALQDVQQSMIVKTAARIDELRTERAKAILGLLRSVA